MSLETIEGLKAHIAEFAVRLQEECAALYAAADEERDGARSTPSVPSGDPDLAIRIQHAAAKRYLAAFGMLEWLLDDTYLAEWCDNINRSRARDERQRLKAQRAEARRIAAMSPEERSAEECAEQATCVMLRGLFTRDVQ